MEALMLIRRSLLCCCIAMVSPGAALAAGLPSTVYEAGGPVPEAFYLGADYLATVYDESEFDGLDLPVLRLRGGVKLHRHFALELVGGVGLSGDTVTSANDDVSASSRLEIDTLFGFYGKPQLPLRFVTLYGLFGFTHVGFQARTDYSCLSGARCEPVCPGIGETCLRVSSEGDEFDFSYGGGAALQLTPHWSLNLDWIRYVDEFYELGGVAGGIRYDF
ncbi:MAG: outer membrane beta-barrel protein [Pseudomonadota bacterium]|jgi:opacity protein-like surface antigen